MEYLVGSKDKSLILARYRLLIEKKNGLIISYINQDSPGKQNN